MDRLSRIFSAFVVFILFFILISYIDILWTNTHDAEFWVHYNYSRHKIHILMMATVAVMIGVFYYLLFRDGTEALALMIIPIYQIAAGLEDILYYGIKGMITGENFITTNLAHLSYPLPQSWFGYYVYGQITPNWFTLCCNYVFASLLLVVICVILFELNVVWYNGARHKTDIRGSAKSSRRAENRYYGSSMRYKGFTERDTRG